MPFWCGQWTLQAMVRGILAVVRGYPLSYALQAYFAGRYHRGRIFHFSTARGLEKWIRLP